MITDDHYDTNDRYDYATTVTVRYNTSTGPLRPSSTLRRAILRAQGVLVTFRLCMPSLNSQISKRAHKARGRTLESQITEIDPVFEGVSKTHLENRKKTPKPSESPRAARISHTARNANSRAVLPSVCAQYSGRTRPEDASPLRE